MEVLAVEVHSGLACVAVRPVIRACIRASNTSH